MTEVMSLEWFQNYVQQIRKTTTDEGVLAVLAIMAGEVNREVEDKYYRARMAEIKAMR